MIFGLLRNDLPRVCTRIQFRSRCFALGSPPCGTPTHVSHDWRALRLFLSLPEGSIARAPKVRPMR